jgi:hypothetical protein
MTERGFRADAAAGIRGRCRQAENVSVLAGRTDAGLDQDQALEARRVPHRWLVAPALPARLGTARRRDGRVGEASIPRTGGVRNHSGSPCCVGGAARTALPSNLALRPTRRRAGCRVRRPDHASRGAVSRADVAGTSATPGVETDRRTLEPAGAVWVNVRQHQASSRTAAVPGQTYRDAMKRLLTSLVLGYVVRDSACSAGCSRASITTPASRPGRRGRSARLDRSNDRREGMLLNEAQHGGGVETGSLFSQDRRGGIALLQCRPSPRWSSCSRERLDDLPPSAWRRCPTCGCFPTSTGLPASLGRRTT